jgi:CARDB
LLPRKEKKLNITKLVLIAAMLPVVATSSDSSEPTNKLKAKVAQPDLIIKQFLFPPANEKALRVHVVNMGRAASGACRLVLTVRKINGVAVGRQTHVNVPALAAGADVRLVIDAKRILPNNVSLASTTFKINVDATEIVAESNESNNEVWHNL